VIPVLLAAFWGYFAVIGLYLASLKRDSGREAK